MFVFLVTFFWRFCIRTGTLDYTLYGFTVYYVCVTAHDPFRVIGGGKALLLRYVSDDILYLDNSNLIIRTNSCVCVCVFFSSFKALVYCFCIFCIIALTTWGKFFLCTGLE